MTDELSRVKKVSPVKPVVHSTDQASSELQLQTRVKARVRPGDRLGKGLSILRDEPLKRLRHQFA